MDFLDDTTRVDEDLEDGYSNDLDNNFFAAPPTSTPHSETLFLPEESDEEPVEVQRPQVKRPSPSPETTRPAKRRRTEGPLNDVKSPQNNASSSEVFGSFFYVGEFLIDDAYSLVSGPNAIRVGETISLTRDTQGGDPMRAKIVPGKEIKGKGKQTTLAGFISQSAKPPAKTAKSSKVDHIVRFTSQSGSHLGRLPIVMAEPISVLMDGLARFSGCVVEVPQKVRTGDSILLSIRAYLSAGAFEKPDNTISDDHPQMFNEGSETATEKNLRERRSSVLKLFELVGLKAQMAAPALDAKGATHTFKGKVEQPPKTKKSARKEVIGEGEDAEEVEVDDDEEVLQDAELDLIYRKYAPNKISAYALTLATRAQKHDQDMEEMEPADSFVMTLRPYQKQALKYLDLP